MKISSYILVNIVFVFLIISCSPKISEPVEEVKTTPPVEEVKVVEPEGCETFKSLNPEQKEEAQTAYVLYRDYLKLKNYEEAFRLWKKAITLAPAGNGRVKYQFDDGIALYKHFYENEADLVKKAELANAALKLYDQRISCFGEEAYIKGRKAFDLYYTFKGTANEAHIYELFKANLDGKGKMADYFVINPFTKIMIDRIIAGEIDTAEAQNYAYQILEVIQYGKENCEGNTCEAWEIIESYAPVRLEALEGYDGFYNCEYYTNKYYSQFLEDSTNCDVINLVYQRLRRGNCSDESSELMKVWDAKKNNCQVVTYTPGPLRLGFNAYEEGNYKLAVEKFREFINNTEDLEKKAKYALLIAKIYYRDLKDFSKSRQIALEAASYRSNWGEPYILIGKLYASSGPLCGPGTGWDSQIVTWPAIDKFKFAKSIDPSVADEANKWIQTYEKYMPSKADIFVRTEINENDSFYVGCWIRENTTVRAAK